jgi:hypothetical protein
MRVFWGSYRAAGVLTWGLRSCGMSSCVVRRVVHDISEKRIAFIWDSQVYKKGHTFLRHFGKHSFDDAASHRRRQDFYMLIARKEATCKLRLSHNCFRTTDFDKITRITVIQMEPVFTCFWANNQKNSWGSHYTGTPLANNFLRFARTILNIEALAFPSTRIYSPISL